MMALLIAGTYVICDIIGLAHLDHGALRILHEIAIGVPEFSIEHDVVCKGCAMGKYVKAPFPSRATGILDLIQTNVSGKFSYISLGGYEYYITFIDDYSRFTWILFLKTKNEVFQCFKEFNALVENQPSRKIKVLRSNNGGEYTKGEFVDFCTSEGIRHEFTIPYTPQQNGVAERKNKAIVGAARAMLHDQGLPLFLWAEACNIAMYLQNKSPHRSLGNQTPLEAC